MRKSLAAAMAVIAIAATAATSPAEARHRGNAFAGGLIGGLAAGAIIGGAAYPYYAAPYGYYPSYPGYPAPVYVPGPAYFGPPPGCVLRNQRVWDGYRWRWQKIRVCH